METSAEKTSLMTKSAKGIQRKIKVKGQKLATATSFKYLGAVVSDDGSKPEILLRIAQATVALTVSKFGEVTKYLFGIRRSGSTLLSFSYFVCL